MTPVAELKLAHRATWAAGDYAAVAAPHRRGPAPRPALAAWTSSPARRCSTSPPAPATSPSAPPPPARTSSASTSRPSCSTTARARAAAPASSSTGSRATPRSSRSRTSPSTACCRRSACSSRRATRSSRTSWPRVCRPGGRIGLVNWTPEGLIGELFKIMGRYMPAPPAFASPPPLWGSEAARAPAVRGHPRRARVRPRPQPVALRVAPRRGSSFMETAYGPTVKARERLTGEGRWEECRARDPRARRAPQRGDRRQPAHAGRVPRSPSATRSADRRRRDIMKRIARRARPPRASRRPPPRPAPPRPPSRPRSRSPTATSRT